MPRRVLEGVVVSAQKTKNTVIVKVSRKFMHPVYKKVVSASKKYAAHDAAGACNEGDIVSIVESRPISKTKHWVILATDNVRN